jgi:hypothetical protein
MIPNQIDLRPYGGDIFTCRGTIFPGRRRPDVVRPLLFLFGENHGVKPYIRDNLLNVIGLDRMGVLDFVGVEGPPDREFPQAHERKLFVDLKPNWPDDEELLEAFLKQIYGSDQYFWSALALMRPEIRIHPVDDLELRAAAEALQGCMGRREGYITARLEGSELFEASELGASPTARTQEIAEKARWQALGEFAGSSPNLERDKKLLENLMSCWGTFERKKVAVLNAGSAHIWRIARMVPDEVDYYHIEQP